MVVFFTSSLFPTSKFLACFICHISLPLFVLLVGFCCVAHIQKVGVRACKSCCVCPVCYWVCVSCVCPMSFCVLLSCYLLYVFFILLYVMYVGVCPVSYCVFYWMCPVSYCVFYLMCPVSFCVCHTVCPVLCPTVCVLLSCVILCVSCVIMYVLLCPIVCVCPTVLCPSVCVLCSTLCPPAQVPEGAPWGKASRGAGRERCEWTVTLVLTLINDNRNILHCPSC